MRRIAAMRRTEGAGEFASGQEGGRFHQREGNRGIKQRGVDQLALASPLPRYVGTHDAEGSEHPASDVRNGDPRLRWWHVGVPGRTHDAAHGLGDGVVAAAVGEGAGLTEAGDRAVDNAPVQLSHSLIVKP
jgi:hypothetical protein